MPSALRPPPSPLNQQPPTTLFSRLLRQFTSRKGDIWLLSAKWTGPVLGMAGGLIAARFLAPAELGVVHAVTLIPLYASFLHFGVFNGLNRNLPMYRGRGEMERAQGFVNASAKTARWVAAAGALVALTAVILFLFRAENPLYAYIALFLIPALVFSPLKLHQDTVYRGMRQFERLGKNLHISNTWAFLCAASTSALGVTGLAIKLATQSLLGWVLLLRNPPLQESSQASFRDVRALSAVGIPMLVSGMIFTWMAAADRTVIATFLTAEDLGHFALATIAMSALTVFPTSINTLLYPRVAHAYGASGTSRALRRYIWIGLGLNLALMLPILVVLWFALPPLVEWLLPAYAPGIPAARVALIGAVFFAYSGPSVIIPILRRNLPLQVGGLIGLALIWILGYLAVRAGHGIVGVATVRALVMALYGCFVVWFVFHLTGKDIRPETA
jgi:O-antigen/teichoic acid export membrane protein